MHARRRTWRVKFADAFRGVWYGMHGQSSFAAHGVATCCVVLAGWWLGVERWEWCLLALCVGLVVVTEMMNSALETLAPVISEEHNSRLGRALDIGSGAVLLAAATALVVGGLILLGHLA